MSEKKALPAVLKGKCPRCRQGDMFRHGAFNLGKFTEMHTDCPHCGYHFEEEPGFYYGAMYVSYALSVGIFLVTSFILYFMFNDPALEVYLMTVAAVALLLFPLTFRYSRILFSYIFGSVGYDRKKSK